MTVFDLTPNKEMLTRHAQFFVFHFGLRHPSRTRFYDG